MQCNGMGHAWAYEDAAEVPFLELDFCASNKNCFIISDKRGGFVVIISFTG